MNKYKQNLTNQLSGVKRESKKPGKPGKKLQLDSTYRNNLLQIPYFAEKRDQYLQRKQFRDIENALYEYHVYDQLKDLTYKSKIVVGSLLRFTRKYRVVRPKQGTLATESFCHIKTVERSIATAREKGILSWKSGKFERVANIYKFSGIFLHFQAKKYIKKALGDIFKDLNRRGCRTYKDYITKKPGTRSKNIDNQTPKCDKDIFFQRKKEKDVVSTLTCDKNTHHQSVRTQETIKGVACSDRTENHAKSLSILQKLGILDPEIIKAFVSDIGIKE